MPVSGVIKGVRSVTIDVTHAMVEALTVEPSTPYSVYVESQQSISGSAIDAQINKNNAMWSYLRYSFLFFIAMVVAWLPSSINRIYSLINPSEANLGLNLTGALVLSLQGSWNAVIYISTALPISKSMWASNIKSRSPLRFRWRATRRKTRGIPLENIGFDGRSSAGSTSALALRPPFEYSTTVPPDV
ncbi:uncharacterized protein N7446_010500 [Penicillium canescens]|nr:uncharacterized protein N7446_010500 [Penicillium canescens]KAJ6050391.1 hypothetical protein N7446_010500 [Penicillium canescens]